MKRGKSPDRLVKDLTRQTDKKHLPIRQYLAGELERDRVLLVWGAPCLRVMVKSFLWWVYLLMASSQRRAMTS
jgi:hypothetical protein